MTPEGFEIRLEQPGAAEIAALLALLKDAYWSPGIPLETVTRACANSVCAMARKDGRFAGFARAVTDKAVFAWVCDVMVAPEHRGRGLGRALVGALRAAPELQGLRRWMLGTRDAHGVYAPLGFGPIGARDRLMEILSRAPYGTPTG